MKSKQQKRNEALARLEASTYKNSKACRTGSATEAQWEKQKQNAIIALTGKRG